MNLKPTAPAPTPRTLPKLRTRLKPLFALALMLAAPGTLAQPDTFGKAKEPPSTAAARPAAPPPVNLPTLGDVEREDLSPLMERKVGEEIMRSLRGDRDYMDDAPILEYLNRFGNALVAARPDVRGEAAYDYFFFAVRDPQLNAFALPGGFIAVHSALLLAADTESELASVLSHEIGHVAQRHIARMLGQQRQDMLIPLAAMLLAALASRAGGDAAIGVFMAGQGLAIQRQLNFGRDAEREADRIGFQIMGAAGYDTSGMVAFFSRMQAASRSYSDLTPAWLLTHPLTTERIADIQARIREQPYKQRYDSLDFYLVKARARVLQDPSEQGLTQAAALFLAQSQQQSRLQSAAGKYGLAFVALKRGQLDKAQALLDEARNIIDKPPAPGTFSMVAAPEPNVIFAATALEILLAPNQPPAVAEKALKEADAARKKFPLSRGIVHQYAEAMMAADKLEPAAEFLREQARLYRDEPEVPDLLAQVYSKQGKLSLQHLALAESYVLQGGLMAGLDQLTLARKAPDANFYDMSVIDAREREWQAIWRERIEAAKK